MGSYEDLPQSLQEIADVVGVDDALKLSEKLGGLRFTIPTSTTLGKDHPITKAIGAASANKLVSAFCSTRIEISIYARKLARNAEIRKAHAGGESVSAIAIRLHKSERQIRRILKQE